MLIIKSVDKVRFREIKPTERSFRSFASHEVLLSKASIMGVKMETWNFRNPRQTRVEIVKEEVPIRKVNTANGKSHDAGVRAIMEKYSFLGDYDNPKTKTVERRMLVEVPKHERIPIRSHKLISSRIYKKDQIGYLVTFASQHGDLQDAGNAIQAFIFDGKLYYLARTGDVSTKFAKQHGLQKEGCLGRKDRQKLSVFVRKVKKADLKVLTKAVNECVLPNNEGTPEELVFE